MKVALAYNVKKDCLPPEVAGASLQEFYAECDSFDTIAAIQGALAERHEVALIEADEEAYGKLRDQRPAFVFNFAEGLWGAARESQVPAMLEMLRIPYTGSDPLTLALCLDKRRTSEVLGFRSIATAHSWIADAREVHVPPCAKFPAVVKPVAEGSSKGIRNTSFVRNEAELKLEQQRVATTVGGQVLVEEFLPGREFTVAMLGNQPNLQFLPIVEVRLDRLPEGANPIYSYEAKWDWDTEDDPIAMYECPAKIGIDLRESIVELCRAAWNALQLRDWARIDVRLDADGLPHILEINPIPGCLPRPDQNSAFPTAARAAGLSFSRVIHTVLDSALARYNMPASGRDLS